MTQYYTDFGSEANGNLANSADWSEVLTGGTWQANVTTDAGATGGKTVVADDNGWGDDTLTLLHDTSGSTTGDIEIVAKVKVASTSFLANNPVGPALLSPTDSMDRYEVHWNGTTGNWRLWWINNGVEWSGIGSAANIYTPVADTYFWVRIGRVAATNTVRASVWPDGSPDPGWQLSGTDANLSALQAGLAYAESSPTPYTTDVYGIGTAGDAAPTSGGGGGGGFQPAWARNSNIVIQ